MTALRDLLTRAGITPPRLTSALPPEVARRIADLVAAARATPAAYGPRRSLSSSCARPRQAAPPSPRSPAASARSGVRPDGYIAHAVSGEAIQRAGRLHSGPDGLRAGTYEVGRFYYSDGGVFYQVGPNLERTGDPVGELALEHGLGPVDAVLDGVEDALRSMIEGIAHLITHPIQSIRDLANLPGVIRALIANAPEYW